MNDLGRTTTGTTTATMAISITGITIIGLPAGPGGSD